ncbi:MAG: Spy/CpxP family protein refolding chaperone [Gammaproteobacteria bacterium]|nr:Spy/CpxP family protein refolding chaperone [Gammaproteobacteria bacterium]
MKRSSKILITTLAVVGITAVGFSWVSAGGWGRNCQADWSQFGQAGPGTYPGHGGWHGKGMMGGVPGSMMEQRMDYLKQRLQITSDQEPAWEAFRQTMNAKTELMAERFQQRGMQLPVTERTNRMRQHAEQMSAMADAVDTFYAALTPEQQKLADSMMPMGRRF